MHIFSKIAFIAIGCFLLACESNSKSPETSEDNVQNQEEPISSETKASDLPAQLIGKGDTTLVFIQGWNIGPNYWDAQIPLVRDNYSVLTFDWIALHKAMAPDNPWTAKYIAADIAKLIELKNLQKVILIGHSMGADISVLLQSLIQDKVIGLIGVDNFKEVAYEASDEEMNGYKQFVDDLEQNYAQTVTNMVEQWLFAENTKNTEAFNRVIRDYQKADPKIAARLFGDMLLISSDIRATLNNMRVPLMLIMSDYTPYDEEALKRNCKNGYSVIEIKDSGHFPMIEQPAQFNQAMLSFLQQIKG